MGILQFQLMGGGQSGDGLQPITDPDHDRYKLVGLCTYHCDAMMAVTSRGKLPSGADSFLVRANFTTMTLNLDRNDIDKNTLLFCTLLQHLRRNNRQGILPQPEIKLFRKTAKLMGPADKVEKLYKLRTPPLWSRWLAFDFSVYCGRVLKWLPLQ